MFSGTSKQQKKSKVGGDIIVDNNNQDCIEGTIVTTTSDTASTPLVADECTIVHNSEAEWVDVEEEIDTTVSKKKIKNIAVEKVKEKELPLGYRLFDCGVLCSVFNKMICPGCKKHNLCLKEESKRGLAFKYSILCSGLDDSCRWSYTFFSSPRAKNNTSKSSKMFDINSRIVYSMRRLGKGLSGLKTFLYLMNHPPTMSEKN